jgi:hypothetical protein
MVEQGVVTEQVLFSCRTEAPSQRQLLLILRLFLPHFPLRIGGEVKERKKES